MTLGKSKIYVINDFSRLGRRKMTKTSSRVPLRQPHLSTRQIADWLGYHERTITYWALAWYESGGVQGIPSHRYGLRKWSFVETEVQEWMDAGGLQRQSSQFQKTGT